MARGVYTLLLAVPAFCQQPATFDAASIKPSPPSAWMAPIKTQNPSRIMLRQFTLRQLVAAAYGIASYQVDGLRSDDRFDIVATGPRSTSSEQALAMLQSLLKERFHLVTHTEIREMPAYVLLPGKSRAKLRPEKDIAEVPGCKSFGTLQEFADILAHNLNAPVRDETGIGGTYFFILAYTNTSVNAAPPGGPGSDAVAPPPPARPNPPPCPGWAAEACGHFRSSAGTNGFEA